jgi:hypothetical protein
VIIAYFTLLAGPTPTPVLVVKDQPIAYEGSSSSAVVDVVVANIGTAQVTLNTGTTKLEIVGPFSESSDSVTPIPDATIAPGESTTLRFTFNGDWTTGKFKDYRSASARLVLKDTAGNTIAQFEVSIRIIGGG